MLTQASNELHSSVSEGRKPDSNAIDCCLTSALADSELVLPVDSVPVKPRRTVDNKRKKKHSSSTSLRPETSLSSSVGNSCKKLQDPTPTMHRGTSSRTLKLAEGVRAPSRLRGRRPKQHQESPQRKTLRNNSKRMLLERSSSSRSVLGGKETANRARTRKIQKSLSSRNIRRTASMNSGESASRFVQDHLEGHHQHLLDLSRKGPVRAASLSVSRCGDGGIAAATPAAFSDQANPVHGGIAPREKNVSIAEFLKETKMAGQDSDTKVVSQENGHCPTETHAPDASIVSRLRGMLRSSSLSSLLREMDAPERLKLSNYVNGATRKNSTKHDKADQSKQVNFKSMNSLHSEDSLEPNAQSKTPNEVADSSIKDWMSSSDEFPIITRKEPLPKSISHSDVQRDRRRHTKASNSDESQRKVSQSRAGKSITKENRDRLNSASGETKKRRSEARHRHHLSGSKNLQPRADKQDDLKSFTTMDKSRHGTRDLRPSRSFSASVA